MNSKQKGKRGELELAHYLTEHGFPAERAQQYKGGQESADISCPDLSDFHIECKRTERFNIYEAMEQAERDAGWKTPVVMHKRNRGEWLAVMPLRFLVAMVKEAKL